MARILNNVISVRLPAEWRSYLTSEQVRAWISEFSSQPVPLYEIPRPGFYRLSIRLSQREFAALVRAGRSISATIRGIVALHISLEPQKNRRPWLKTIFTTGFVLLTLLTPILRRVGQKSENS